MDVNFLLLGVQMWQGRFEIRARVGSSNRLAKTA